MVDEFHDVIFPSDIGQSLGQLTERQVDIVKLANGQVARNTKNYASIRQYKLAFGADSFENIASIMNFYEARRGPLIGFKWQDCLDYKSCSINAIPAATDQKIGQYNNGIRAFQLVKKYGEFSDEAQNYLRKITKPKPNSLTVQVGDNLLENSQFSVDHLTGMVTIDASIEIVVGADIFAGFEFDVPVRFHNTQLNVDFLAFKAGKITNITLQEILD